MKNLKIICLIGLFMLAGTQYTQAQTKEETIEWITEKLEKYGGEDASSIKSHFEDVTVSPCKITYTKVVITDWGKLEKYKCSFNPSLVKEWVAGSTKIVKTGEKISEHISSDAKIIKEINIETMKEYYLGEIKLKNREPNIAERMAKALKHLATFCEQKKEAF